MLGRPVLAALWIAGIGVLVEGNEPKLFYIYDFPTVPLDFYPNRSTVLGVRHTKTRVGKAGKRSWVMEPVPPVWKHDFNENEGFGKCINGTKRYETWQYAAFRVILARLMRSKYRTRDINKAELFFIPYDTGTEGYVDEYGCYRNVGNPMADYALLELKKLQTLAKNQGFDHFWIHSSSLVAHKASLKLRDIFNLFSPNITVLTVEKLPVLYRFVAQLPFVQPIPMASVYHWGDAAGTASLPVLISSRKNEIFISFFGSANTMVRNSNQLRYRLFYHCDEANKAVTSGVPGVYLNVSAEFDGKICHISSFKGGSAERNTVGTTDVMAAYEKSVYCLCPFGDTPIRRAIFDAVLAGCIPVLFRTKGSPYPIDQYDWHLSKQEIDDAFEFIDVSSFVEMTTFNYIERLCQNYCAGVVERKQKALANIARKLQYSVPPDVRQFGMPTVAEELPVWDPPLPDAVDIILEQMGRKVDKYVHGRKW